MTSVRSRTLLVAIAALAICVFLFSRSVGFHSGGFTQPGTVHRDPILIPGVAEPEELRVQPLPSSNLTPPEQMLRDTLPNLDVRAKTFLPGISRVLAKYPDYAQGYLLRLGVLCSGTDGAAVLSDINSFLGLANNDRMEAESRGPLLSMRAKIEFGQGDNAQAISDLDEAMKDSVSNVMSIVNSGAVAPEKNASLCGWSEPIVNALVARFPTDPRTHTFRGIYYGFFVSWDQDALEPAIENLRHAAALAPRSALPPLVLAQVLEKSVGLRSIAMSQGQRDSHARQVIEHLNTALAIDPNLVPALAARAEARYRLKQLDLAVADYDRILVLNPSDAGAHNDRGLALMALGKPYEAISALTEAVENKQRDLQGNSDVSATQSLGDTYINRADAYFKTNQFDLAIHDLTSAMSWKVGGVALLMNAAQFRAIYPEYRSATDESLARKLQQTFYPNLRYEDFAKSFLHDNVARGFFASTYIPDLYLKRSDVFLRAGQWHNASTEFWRAVRGFPTYASAIDRWREIGIRPESHQFLDLRTFDDADADSIKLWTKESASADGEGAYSLYQYELQCRARKLRVLSSARYAASGDLESSHEGGEWSSVVPDSMGEQLVACACPGSR